MNRKFNQIWYGFVYDIWVNVILIRYFSILPMMVASILDDYSSIENIFSIPTLISSIEISATDKI